MKKDFKDYVNFLSKQPKGFLYNDETKSTNMKNIKNCAVASVAKTKPERNALIATNKPNVLNKLYAEHSSCQGCPLFNQGRSQVVFGVGNPNSPLVFVGEAPGRDEDKQGVPFIGRAGQLLTKIIEAMGFTREDVFITNVAKCRPPENRTPLPEEREKCKSLILLKELEIIQPKIICTLGLCATQGLLGNEIKISQTRGKFFEWNNYLVLPTYHPAYLLRNPAEKRTVWEDMKLIMEKLKELGA